MKKINFRYVSQQEREKLYKEVWDAPLTTVAKRYDMSDNGLRKHLKRLGIPLPRAGYWAKIKAGQKIDKPGLPPVQGDLKKYVHGYIIKYKSGIEQLSDEELMNSGELSLLTDDTTFFIKETCSQLQVKSQLRKPGSLIAGHMEESKYRKKRDEALQRAKFNTNYFNLVKSEHRDNEAMLPIAVSDANLKRAYRILDTVIKTLDNMEGRTRVSLDMDKDIAYFILMHTYFYFEMKEVKSKRQKFTDEEKSLPIIVLSLRASYLFHGGTQQTLEYSDSKIEPLENQVGNIILEMFQTANRLCIKDILDRREEERKKAERERQQKLEQMRRGELDEIKILNQAALDWEKVRRIRSFADDMELKIQTLNNDHKKEQLQKWLAWARDKADWLDPLTVKDDGLLGVSEYILFKILQDE